MNRKVFGIFVIMMLLIPVLSSIIAANQEPVLEIGKIRSRSRFLRGAVVIIVIKNIGDVDAKNVTWSFDIKHPIFKILNLTGGFNFTINKIKAGLFVIKTIGISWIGRFEITVKAWIPGENPVSKTVKGISIFSFILIFPG